MAKAKLRSKTKGWDDRLKVVKVTKLVLWTVGIALVVGAVLFFGGKYAAKKLTMLSDRFNSIQFAEASWELSPDAKVALDDIADFLQKPWHKYMDITVEGHTSKEGEPQKNQILSEKRAQSVVDYLISKGVAEDRLKSVGYGSSKPKDENSLQPNRRIEFVID